MAAYRQLVKIVPDLEDEVNTIVAKAIEKAEKDTKREITGIIREVTSNYKADEDLDTATKRYVAAALKEVQAHF